MVVGGEPDVALLFGRVEVGDDAAVELLEGVGVGTVLADAVQQIEKGCIALPIDGFEFDGDVFGLPQGVAREEIRRVVVLTQ